MACSSPLRPNTPTAIPKPQVSEISVKLDDKFQIVLDRNSVPAGTVRFVVENTGKKTHELVIEAADAVDIAFETEGKKAELELEAGTKGVLEWKLDQPGKYRLACHLTGNNTDHFEKGMKTELTVTGAKS